VDAQAPAEQQAFRFAPSVQQIFLQHHQGNAYSQECFVRAKAFVAWYF
jgi:hypothetical protein